MTNWPLPNSPLTQQRNIGLSLSCAWGMPHRKHDHTQNNKIVNQLLGCRLDANDVALLQGLRLAGKHSDTFIALMAALDLFKQVDGTVAPGQDWIEELLAFLPYARFLDGSGETIADSAVIKDCVEHGYAPVFLAFLIVTVRANYWQQQIERYKAARFVGLEGLVTDPLLMECQVDYPWNVLDDHDCNLLRTGFHDAELTSKELNAWRAARDIMRHLNVVMRIAAPANLGLQRFITAYDQYLAEPLDEDINA